MPQSISENNITRTCWPVWVALVICIMVIGVSLGGFCYFYLFRDLAMVTRAQDTRTKIRYATSSTIEDTRTEIPTSFSHTASTAKDENEDVEEQENIELCLTRNCLEASIAIMSSLDITQDPCEDFYQFTCGNFIANAYKRNTPSPYFTQTIRNRNRLKAIISEPIGGDEHQSLLLQKQFYRSCMNVTAIDEDENETFKELLEELGGWPILEGRSTSKRKLRTPLKQLLIKCKNLGIPFQWLFEIKYEDKWKTLNIGPPKITKKYNNSFKKSVYRNLIVETAIVLGISKIPDENEVDKILNFEKELEELVARHNMSMYTLMNVTELDKAFPKVSWFQFISNLTEGANFTFTEKSTVNAHEVYLRELDLLLEDTSRRVLVNDIIWKIVQEFGHYMSNPLRDNFGNFTNFMSPEPQQQPTRFSFCIAEATARFPRVAELEYLRLYVNEKKSTNITHMISNIKDQFIFRLESADWINDATKDKAINKVRNILEIIGHHKLDFDAAILRKFINTANLELTSNNIIHMIREKNVYDFKQQFLLADIPSVDRLSEAIFKTTIPIGASYMDVLNIIVLAAGIVQDNLYSEDRPNYLNYGALGSVIAHEIAHGFTKNAYNSLDKERKTILRWFNESLRDMRFYSTTELWQDKSLSKLIERMQCLVDDQKRFNEVGNDDKRLAEDFADLFGINVAYDAYIKWVEENTEEPYLPSLPFNPRQLFWIQYGIINCFKRIDGSDWTIIEGRHASQRYRVMNPLRNSYNFANDFNCSLGTAMNLRTKCHIF